MTFQEGVLYLVKHNADLTMRQMAILFACMDGPHTVRGLAAKLDLGKATVTRSVDKMEAGIFPALLVRSPDPADRRSVLINATEAGMSFARSLLA